MLNRHILKLALSVLTLFSFIQPAWAEIEAGNLELVDSTRISRFDFQYQYRLQITNTGDKDIENVSATVSSSNPVLILVNDSLQFNNLASGEGGASVNTFTIRVDRRQSYDVTDLSYNFTFNEVDDPDPDPTGTDNDADGFTVESGDCDDTNPAINQEADEIPNNGIDENCDGEDLIIPLDFGVRITSPPSLATLGVTPISVKGQVEGDNVSLTVNNVPVTVTNGMFDVSVALEEGHNVIEARLTKDENQVSDTVTVSLDQTPPFVTIESHGNGQQVFSSPITVTGLINDIVRGTIEENQAAVKVNNINADISNRSYAAKNVELQPGLNEIKVTGTDQVGNVGTTSIQIEYVVPEGRRLELVSGQEQSAVIDEVLPQPLKVRVLDDSLAPVEDAAVVFRVTQGSGAVGADESNEGRAVVIDSDSDGMAITKFRLGTRVGTANQKVRVQVVGYDDEVVFNASALGKIGDKLSVNSGNNQRGAVGQVLPEPLVVVVTDEGANVVQGARVKFTIDAGEGQLQNGEKEYTTQTDSDGRAAAEVTLGYLTGIDAQRITATLLDATPGQVISAGFVATGFVPKEPGLTTISGIVLDNNDQPIEGVSIRIDGINRETQTDSEGLFVLTEAPVGPVHLIADGSTAVGEGEYPTLTQNIVTVSGVENPLAAPIYMVKLDTDGAVLAGPEDASLTLESYPGFQLDIVKDSVTFPDGSRQGLVSVTPVNASKVPMAPPNGMQPQFIVTIQPAGTRFDPPARLTLPNVDGHKPGAQVEMYSFDHDLEEFVSIGLGTVNENGTTIQSNPGVGVIKAGWHCGSQPSGSGCCEKGKQCSYCESKTGGCPSGCKFEPTRPAETQIPGNCQTELCGGSEKNDGDLPPAECGTCEDGTPVVDTDKVLNPENQKPDDCKELKCGGGFNPMDSETPALQQSLGNVCKECKNGEVANVPADQKKPCGNGSTEQECYTCKNGKCDNHCEASTVTNKVEYTGLSYVAEALTAFPDALDKSPIFTASLKPFINISGESGEKCCKNCATPGPQKFTKFSGSAGVKGTVQATIPYLGIAHKFPSKPTTFIGFSVKGNLFITAAGATIEVDAKGETSFLDIDCPGEDCGDIFLGATFNTLIGPQVNISVALVNCSSSQCDDEKDGKSGSNFTVFAAEGKGSIALTVKGSIGLKRVSGPQCGSNCIGGKLDPITGAAKGSISFEILFKKWTLSGSTDPIEFYAGGGFGPGCSK